MTEMRPTSLLSRLGVFRTLKSKIILLTIGAVLVSTLALTALLTSRIAEVTRETALERLAGETRLMALQFKDAYDRMKADVQVLAGTPPTRGIARAPGRQRHGSAGRVNDRRLALAPGNNLPVHHGYAAGVFSGSLYRHRWHGNRARQQNRRRVGGCAQKGPSGQERRALCLGGA